MNPQPLLRAAACSPLSTAARLLRERSSHPLAPLFVLPITFFVSPVRTTGGLCSGLANAFE
ncbi:hypothetical protein DL89DRAFT_265299 [Linderina pennispora]|uniref:Uncharacterized protein n=1 Tax=Linderina pennispora TaxID=61395 RepID=A0A1Y1WI23_9FUNG|nr:uncharacterized protein DL89DRAFT_265707 [Linderina pennispora]XP_040746507.1 uncharacterized protein DL89DRAFT_265299 [Linderina pennispora]ORX72040.1 hypothetical protein DL89DRAFT_265707 [Linderina pennispora]ORX73167.1 hypothetical protein DL89DRAFT_265299 [Linderina pennispora]